MKFTLDKDNPQVSQLPLILRKRVHEEVSELLIETDEYFNNPENEEKLINYPAIRIDSETCPASYMFAKDDDRVIVAMHIYNETLSNSGSVLTFNFNRNEIDKLLEE